MNKEKFLAEVIDVVGLVSRRGGLTGLNHPNDKLELDILMEDIEKAETLEVHWQSAYETFKKTDSINEKKLAYESLKSWEKRLLAVRDKIESDIEHPVLKAVVMNSMSGEKSLFDFIYPQHNVQVYLPDGSNSAKVHDAINDLLYALACSGCGHSKIKKSSWSFRRFFRSFVPNTEENTAKAIQEKLEICTTDKIKAESDAALANAVSGLITALHSETHAAVRVGTILIVKTTNSSGQSAIATCTLSANQSKLLDKEPQLLDNPSLVLNSLGIKETKEFQVDSPSILNSQLGRNTN